ncbi:MAG: hypothetical protein ACXV5H_08815 [Halobacteriota archaeon]
MAESNLTIPVLIPPVSFGAAIMYRSVCAALPIDNRASTACLHKVLKYASRFLILTLIRGIPEDLYAELETGWVNTSDTP